MTHGSLFSGIGGFDLAAEWMGWENVFHCEINPFGRRVLHHYWPNATSYEDITATKFTIRRGRIDVLTGGFPCQPYSTAGKRLGKEDSRHLWPEMLRAIREIQPRWVVGENVRGLTNWNGGLVFDEVQADLETSGYEVLPFLLPACAVNAPHRRDRIWFVAHASSDGFQSRRLGEDRSTKGEGAIKKYQRKRIWADTWGVGTKETITDPCGERLQVDACGKFGSVSEKTDQSKRRCINRSHTTGECWSNFPTQPPVRSRNDGLPSGLVGITVSKHRNESLKAYGNAIVPQEAYQIFKAIQQYES